MKISNEVSLLDSNVLVFAHNLASPFQDKAKKLLFSTIDGEIKAALSPQNLLEFYSIITDPRRVEKPLLSSDVQYLINEYLIGGAFIFIHPQASTIKRTLDLAAKYRIRRAEIFDAYLVATMLDNDVKVIYTDNESHFKIFDELTVINPFK